MPVLGKKRIIKNGGPMRRRDTRGHCPKTSHQESILLIL
jgi:hypothetical protein